MPPRHAPDHSEALELLYERYAHLIYSLLMRMVGEPDVAGDVVRRVFAQIHPTGSGHGAIAPWLLVQAQRLGAAELRRRRTLLRRDDVAPRADPLNLDLPDAPPDLDATAAWDPQLSARRRQVRGALETLSREQRRTLDLAYFQGYTQEEIAGLTGESLATVRSHLRLSLLHLQQATRPTLAQEDP